MLKKTSVMVNNNASVVSKPPPMALLCICTIMIYCTSCFAFVIFVLLVVTMFTLRIVRFMTMQESFSFSSFATLNYYPVFEP